MLHPPVTHFAIVLPIISLVLGLAYLYKSSELMSKISTRFMAITTIFIIIAFFTGKEDASDVYVFLSGDGQTLLKEHKNIALYLMIGMIVVTIIKLYGCYKKIIKLEVIAIVLLALIAGGILYQGKMGGELTYTYGANVQDHSDGMECLDDPEEFLQE